jgi:hypothetical protein
VRIAAIDSAAMTAVLRCHPRMPIASGGRMKQVEKARNPAPAGNEDSRLPDVPETRQDRRNSARTRCGGRVLDSHSTCLNLAATNGAAMSTIKPIGSNPPRMRL